jgi:hypothetical protein
MLTASSFVIKLFCDEFVGLGKAAGKIGLVEVVCCALRSGLIGALTLYCNDKKTDRLMHATSIIAISP